MKGYEFADIDVAHAITISNHERLTIDMVLNSLHPSTGHRIQSSIGQGHREILFVMCAVVANHVITAQANREVVVHRFIVKEVFLDHGAAISQAKDEVVKSEMGV